MSIALSTVSASGQLLIDARLDAIEQALFGRMPRSERQTIVREVESQIHELLSESGVDEASREDVLAVLARLDPPEAYIGDDDAEGSESVRRSRTAYVPSTNQTRLVFRRADRLAMVGGLLGMCGLGMLMSAAMVYAVVVGGRIEVAGVIGGLLELSVVGVPFLAVSASLTSLSIAVYTRFRSGWSVVGASTSTMTLLGAALAAAMYFVG